MKLIHDITPVNELDIPAYMRGFGNLRRHSTDKMVIELHRRGVTIEDIFGMYYAMEEQANHKDDLIFGSSEEGHHGQPKLTVSDAQLAMGTTTINYNQPF